MEAEVVALRDEFHQLALANHRKCYERALDAAIEERALDADIVLH